MIIMISLKMRNYKYFVGVVGIVFNDYDDDDDDDPSDDDNHEYVLINDEELQVHDFVIISLQKIKQSYFFLSYMTFSMCIREYTM